MAVSVFDVEDEMYLTKAAAQPGVGTQLVQRVDGLGCCRDGLGLFDGGLNPSTWGIAEWATVLFGGYTLMSLVSTTKRGYSSVRRSVRSRASKQRRKAELKDQLSRL